MARSRSRSRSDRHRKRSPSPAERKSLQSRRNTRRSSSSSDSQAERKCKVDVKSKMRSSKSKENAPVSSRLGRKLSRSPEKDKNPPRRSRSKSGEDRNQKSDPKSRFRKSGGSGENRKSPEKRARSARSKSSEDRTIKPKRKEDASRKSQPNTEKPQKLPFSGDRSRRSRSRDDKSGKTLVARSYSSEKRGRKLSSEKQKSSPPTAKKTRTNRSASSDEELPKIVSKGLRLKKEQPTLLKPKANLAPSSDDESVKGKKFKREESDRSRSKIDKISKMIRRSRSKDSSHDRDGHKTSKSQDKSSAIKVSKKRSISRERSLSKHSSDRDRGRKKKSIKKEPHYEKPTLKGTAVPKSDDEATLEEGELQDIPIFRGPNMDPISTNEFKKIQIEIRRNLPHQNSDNLMILRTVADPEKIYIPRKPNEGKCGIFNRDEIKNFSYKKETIVSKEDQKIISKPEPEQKRRIIESNSRSRSPPEQRSGGAKGKIDLGDDSRDLRERLDHTKIGRSSKANRIQERLKKIAYGKSPLKNVRERSPKPSIKDRLDKLTPRDKIDKPVVGRDQLEKLPLKDRLGGKAETINQRGDHQKDRQHDAQKWGRNADRDSRQFGRNKFENQDRGDFGRHSGNKNRSRDGKDFESRSGKDFESRDGKDFGRRSGSNFGYRGVRNFGRNGRDFGNRGGMDFGNRDGRNFGGRGGRDFGKCGGSRGERDFGGRCGRNESECDAKDEQEHDQTRLSCEELESQSPVVKPWKVNPEMVPKGRYYFEHDNRKSLRFEQRPRRDSRDRPHRDFSNRGGRDRGRGGGFRGQRTSSSDSRFSPEWKHDKFQEEVTRYEEPTSKTN